jgi:hypothetical protein
MALKALHVVDVVFRDAYAVIEISITDLIKLKTALDLSKVEYSSSDEAEVEAVNYLTNRLYPDIVEIINKVKEKAHDGT